MRTATVAFLLACLVAALLTPLLRRFALRHRLIDDHVSARRVHGRPIPRLGGLAIAAAFYVPLLALLFEPSSVGEIFYADSRMAIAFLAGGVALCALGLLDDIRGSGAPIKFLVQFAIAGGLYYFGFRIEVLSLPFLGTVSLGALSLLFTLLWIVGVINAMNLIDGLDGLAAGVGLFGVLTAFVLAATRGDPIMMLFMASLAGSLVGFLFYNFNPASIFMGDTGSMFIGYVLAVGSVQTSQKSSTVVAILVPLVALGLPIADTLLAMIRRALRHRPLFSADRSHIHHKLLDLGLSQKQAVLVLYGVSILLGGTALLLTVASSRESAAILVAMGLLGFLAMRKLGYGHIRRASSSQADMDTQRQLDRLAATSDEERLWVELKGAAQVMSMSAIRIVLAYRNESDSVSVQRESGDFEGPTGARGSFEAKARNATIRVEFRAPSETVANVDALKQAIECACGRMFGRAGEKRRVRTGELPTLGG
ncbi:MAG: undecaprenyl/decaprenyl-phosphate alpha-N-acetylglucosaminyl 1-phosphate transferase [Deltaproteobacteria bacterium]|nr:undecaprenyl/decaprenyl-phosphate alpha-N-acetylglucosaminyl 1-phosphate transferase [Deltaproteobacteria bacterium]